MYINVDQLLFYFNYFAFCLHFRVFVHDISEDLSCYKSKIQEGFGEAGLRQLARLTRKDVPSFIQTSSISGKDIPVELIKCQRVTRKRKKYKAGGMSKHSKKQEAM